jgi:DNA-binding MarR family transcriptional regulator
VTRETRAGAASRVWVALRAFVDNQDRDRLLRDTLGVGPRRAALLIELTEGPMTRTQIARFVERDPPAATVAVDGLQARGLVRREPHPDDQRRKLVQITDAGRETAARAQEILAEPPAALAELSSAELATITALVERLHTVGKRW